VVQAYKRLEAPGWRLVKPVVPEDTCTVLRHSSTEGPSKQSKRDGPLNEGFAPGLADDPDPEQVVVVQKLVS
jgi:hypothetical protein